MTYRGGIKRTGIQADIAWTHYLGDPAQVKRNWAIKWQFPTPNIRLPNGSPAVKNFIASPVVFNGVAYIGSDNGVFYAINMADGSLKWLYPDPSKNPNGPKALIGKCILWGNHGIQASAAITNIKGVDTVIFGAPDPNPQTDGGNGSARLWALDAQTGQAIWKYDGVHDGSDVVARVTGCNLGAFPSPAPPNTPPAEYHETVKYSAPLVNTVSSPTGEPGTVYVGIDSEENPIQQGAVRYVNLGTGKASSTYYKSEPNGQVGGDVWNAPASDGRSIYFTTGNERQWDGVTPSQQSQPNPHYGLSMVRTAPNGSLSWFSSPSHLISTTIRIGMPGLP